MRVFPSNGEEPIPIAFRGTGKAGFGCDVGSPGAAPPDRESESWAGRRAFEGPPTAGHPALAAGTQIWSVLLPGQGSPPGKNALRNQRERCGGHSNAWGQNDRRHRRRAEDARIAVGGWRLAAAFISIKKEPAGTWRSATPASRNARRKPPLTGLSKGKHSPTKLEPRVGTNRTRLHRDRPTRRSFCRRVSP